MTDPKKTSSLTDISATVESAETITAGEAFDEAWWNEAIALLKATEFPVRFIADRTEFLISLRVRIAR